MSIRRDLPEVRALLNDIETKTGLVPKTHEDFSDVRETIYRNTKELISETTLERIWGYSTRGYDNISLRSLNLLTKFAGYGSWENFIARLRKEGRIESGMFDRDLISSHELEKGDTLVFGWLPDRKCRVRYLGDNRYLAIETENSKIKEGDSFSCLQFQLGMPLYMEDLTSGDGCLLGKRYGVGLHNGLISLRLE